jgi:hypothetical protein
MQAPLAADRLNALGRAPGPCAAAANNVGAAIQTVSNPERRIAAVMPSIADASARSFLSA